MSLPPKRGRRTDIPRHWIEEEMRLKKKPPKPFPPLPLYPIKLTNGSLLRLPELPWPQWLHDWVWADEKPYLFGETEEMPQEPCSLDIFSLFDVHDKMLKRCTTESALREIKIAQDSIAAGNIPGFIVGEDGHTIEQPSTEDKQRVIQHVQEMLSYYRLDASTKGARSYLMRGLREVVTKRSLIRRYQSALHEAAHATVDATLRKKLLRVDVRIGITACLFQDFRFNPIQTISGLTTYDIEAFSKFINQCSNKYDVKSLAECHFASAAAGDTAISAYLGQAKDILDREQQEAGGPGDLGNITCNMHSYWELENELQGRKPPANDDEARSRLLEAWDIATTRAYQILLRAPQRRLLFALTGELAEKGELSTSDLDRILAENGFDNENRFEELL